jgi:hypothetical protein
MSKEDTPVEIEVDGEMVEINEELFDKPLRKKKSRVQTQDQKKKKQPKLLKIKTTKTTSLPREDVLRLDDETAKRSRKTPRYLNDFDTYVDNNDISVIDDKDSEYQVKRQMMDKPRWTEFKKDEKDELPGETLFPFITKQYKTIRNQKNKNGVGSLNAIKVKENDVSAFEEEESL